MPIAKAPIESTLKPGVYDARFRGIDEKVGKNPSTKEDQVYWRWNFGVQTKAGEKDLFGNSSTSFGKKSKGRSWAEAVLGRAIKAGEEIDLDKLIGLPCKIVVTTTELDDVGTVNRIESVVAAPAVDDDEQDVIA